LPTPRSALSIKKQQKESEHTISLDEVYCGVADFCQTFNPNCINEQFKYHILGYVTIHKGDLFNSNEGKL
jgi:hypothetical protein|tara:strand:+ start:131 stop:340 length:210 start_codon:yes stop_codon:yes gene_type:complete